MKLLLHTCCGPCLLAARTELSAAGHEITAFWYNPNIHPWAEYQKRLMTAGYLCRHLSLPMETAEPGFTGFLESLVDAGREGGRCRECRLRRLEMTARKAVELGFPAFSTTLLASPHQDHRELVAGGTGIARSHGIAFVPGDFRAASRETVPETKRLGLYRQNYCGCLFSEWERRAGKP